MKAKSLALLPLLLLLPPARADKPVQGLRGEYYADRQFNQLGTVRIDPSIDFTFDKQPPYKGMKLPTKRGEHYEHFAVRWIGRVVPRYSETYTFHVTVDDGALLWIEDRLVLQTWKEQNPTEHTAEVKLTADRPVPIKLLYFNAWFAGSIKLAWSSPSQKKEIIPASQLLPPEEEKAPAVAKLELPESRVQVSTITLPVPIRNDPDGKKPSLILKPHKEGGGLLGWNDQKGVLHLSRLGADGKLDPKEIQLKDLDLRGLVLHEDGAIGVMAAQLPDRMCVLRLDRDGKEVFRTTLVGEKGRGEGQHFLDDHFSFTGRFTASKDLYAVHFAHSAHHGKGGVHQGGYYAELDFTGKVVRKNDWTVSHSLDQRLIQHRDAFLTLSAGDCFPKGLYYENRTLGLGRILFPEPAKQKEFGNCAGFVNATLGSLVPVGPHVGLTFFTKEGQKNLLLYLLFEEDGRELRQVKLAEGEATKEQWVTRMAPFGNHLLLAWQEPNRHTKVIRLHPSGVLMSEPISTPERLPQNDDLVVFPNGDVGWLNARTGEKRVKLIRIRAD